MGASTGVGALIVGVAMLSVFVLANSTLDAQIESGIERMEKSREQVSPSFSIDDASNDVDAIDALAINTAGSGYSTGGTLSATSLDSITITDGGATYSAGTLTFVDDCTTSPTGSYGVTAGVIDSITLSGIGVRCSAISSVSPSDAGDGAAVLTPVLASSLGFSGTYTQSTGSVNSVTIVSAGKGFSRVPLLSTSEAGLGVTDATFTVGTGNILTFNLTNDGNENMEVIQIWFALDGGTPKRMDLQTYSEWDFPKYEIVFPGETLMVVFDLSAEADITPQRVAATCMGGITAKAVVENS
jgi:hypothetical protein